MLGFLFLALVIVSGAEAFRDGIDEIHFELLISGIEEGAEFGDLAVEFGFGFLAEGVAGFGEVDGEALDGFREEFLDGGVIEGLGGIRVIFGETGAGQGLFEVEGFLEFSAEEADAIPALNERVTFAVRDDAGAEDDAFAGIEVAEVDAGGLVAAELAEELVLHPTESGVEFPEQVQPWPEIFLGTAADDFPVECLTVCGEGDEAGRVGDDFVGVFLEAAAEFFRLGDVDLLAFLVGVDLNRDFVSAEGFEALLGPMIIALIE